MPVQPILFLGDPMLWQACPAVPHLGNTQLPRRGHSGGYQDLTSLFADLRDTLLAFRRRNGTAKAIAAPQIGVLARVVYLHQPGPPRFLVNPMLKPLGTKTTEAWESCMSFPGLYVRTRRSAACSVTYVDRDGEGRAESASGELAVVLQHECDHLDGVLSLQRAADEHSFFLGGPGRRPPASNPR